MQNQTINMAANSISAPTSTSPAIHLQQPTSHEAAYPRASFMGMPTELQLQIMKDVFYDSGDKIKLIEPQTGQVKPNHFALMRTCKHLHAVATDLLDSNAKKTEYEFDLNMLSFPKKLDPRPGHGDLLAQVEAELNSRGYQAIGALEQLTMGLEQRTLPRYQRTKRVTINLGSWAWYQDFAVDFFWGQMALGSLLQRLTDLCGKAGGLDGFTVGFKKQLFMESGPFEVALDVAEAVDDGKEIGQRLIFDQLFVEAMLQLDGGWLYNRIKGYGWTDGDLYKPWE